MKNIIKKIYTYNKKSKIPKFKINDVNGKRHKMMNLTIRLKTLNETISFVKSWLYNTERFDHDIDHPQLKTETLYIYI